MAESRPRSWTTETEKADRPFTLARHRHRRGLGFPRHGHDYLECFWLESGDYLHERNGVTTTMRVGEIAFLKPGEFHRGEGAGAKGGVIVNLAFPTASAEGLAADLGADWPWSWPAERRTCLSHANLGRLHGWLRDLQPPANTRAGLLGVLADLARLLARPGEASDFPQWLTAARTAFCARDPLPVGVAHFIAAGGRSPEHTARAVRQLTGLSLTNYLNDLRLDHAATWLHWTTDPVQDVAVRCGLANLPHFYRCFRRRFDVTPAQFRERPDALGRRHEPLLRNGSVTYIA